MAGGEDYIFSDPCGDLLVVLARQTLIEQAGSELLQHLVGRDPFAGPVIDDTNKSSVFLSDFIKNRQN